ncbi:SMI1/KNR4 family protein [Actinomadura parmotrematis]|uniref:SMI1/KNR4 family protein n=1 Tax=Actinomadura parmotrematis TaxID=2864039 RepID=A0ABS7G095_9ACTN|nr:SMI1/KNR4 family protein [Actinomadura parmotrematis]MBW8485078.1 SMI1/KNR4 family protein [Actinomadura parmotrematis]
MNDHDELVRRVAERAGEEAGAALVPATAGQVAEAEAALGFPLPPLLARLYREVGDGGFGPEYRLLPLIDGAGPTAVGTYREKRAPGRWPAGVLPILTWGCAMYAAVDCTDPAAPVLLFEPSAVTDDWEHAWFLDAGDLADWLRTWLADAGWYEEEIMEDPSFVGPQPWPDAARRLA